ncbi:hypothetical protein BS17DRAFT_790003 [Gyrodon lividus]|nr:hypothetical protein BS17DRAFT_790003 [Gyrodon lividus]
MHSSFQVSHSLERPHASIGHLPIELMMMIFHGVHDLCLDKWTDTLNRVDSPSSTLFPHALAMVCPAWRKMLSSVPPFWTRVVIAIDDNPTPWCLVKGSFEWSRPLPIDVLIAPHGATYKEDPRESNRVEAVMQCLIPELHRCLSIRINTIQVSSLPPLRSFSGQALLLGELELACTPYDPWAEEEAGDVAVPLDFRCPELETLHVNGRNFCNVCPSFVDSGISFTYELWLSRLPNLTSVTISQYRAGGHNKGLSMARMLRALQDIPHLGHLAIKNVDFDDEPIRRRSYTLSTNLSCLEFSDLSNGVYLFFRAVQQRIYEIYIAGCNVTIAQYRAGGRNKGLSMARMLRALQDIPHLGHLAIKNVDFDDEPIRRRSYTLSTNLSCLEFSDLSNGMYLFFRAVQQRMYII